MEELDIVIVGGGIAGLATSLALHRKGIKSIVLERSESVRSEGAAFGIQTNGWLALEQLGVADKLRLNSLPINQIRDVLIEKGIKRRESRGVVPASHGEARGVVRNDLVRALAHALPLGTLRLGCQISSVELDETTSFAIVHVRNGQNIKAKVLIGCDGSNSIVSGFLGLKPTKAVGARAVRGFTNYRDGHGFRQEFIRIKMDNVVSGRLPITHKLVFWFVVMRKCPQDSNVLRNQEDVARLTLESVRDFSEEWKEMVKNCDIDSLYISRLRYRAPWDVLSGKFRRGTVTVAGDSMHLMGPFLGQGCSAALEDGVVLARCLWRKLGQDGMNNNVSSRNRIEDAIDEYIRERRGRLVRLSAQTYITGRLVEASSPVSKLLLVFLLMILFHDQIGHTRYDCGRL